MCIRKNKNTIADVQKPSVMKSRTSLQHFIEVPAWQRGASGLLAVVGVLVLVALYLGIEQRITDGFNDSVDSTYRDAQQVADAMDKMTQARMQMTSQIGNTLEHASTASTPKALDNYFKDNFGLGSSVAVSVWVDESGQVRYSSEPKYLRTRVPKDWLSQAATGHATLVIRGTSAADVAWGLPISQEVALFGHKGDLFVLFPEAHFNLVSSQLLAARHGFITLLAKDGRVFACADENGSARERNGKLLARSHFGPMRPDAASTPDSDFLAGHAQEATGILTVVGLQYGDHMRAWEERRDKTRVMAGIIFTVVAGLLLGAVVALTRSVRTERQLRSLVALDPLTALPNRRTFTDLLSTEIVHAVAPEGRPLGIMFIDLDDFKYVNDSLGHEVGDMLLQHVGDRLVKSVRGGDVVCRIGGDEFTVVLPGVDDAKAAEAVAQRILTALVEPFALGGATLSMSASIGIAMCPADADTTTHLVRCADMAVYRAKALGKSCMARYTPELLQVSKARSALAQELTDALSRQGELQLYYQPKIVMASGALEGFEALLRWRHPLRGMVMPAEFIPVAEESELIVRLGDFVVEEAVRQIQQWYVQGQGWKKVAINVSARQLRKGHIATVVQNALTHYEVPGKYLQLELTETMLASDVDAVAATLEQLKSLGVAIAVDDFGTGYSSLLSLQSLDVDCIKVDRSFVSEMSTNHDSAEIVRAIINLAHNLELKVVAEGIETLEQYSDLMNLGCDEGQGYFFAKPLPAEQAIGYRASVILFTPVELAA